MSDSSRRTLHWIVLVIAIFLTVISIVDIVRGESGFALWIGVICWPIVVIAEAYQLATGFGKAKNHDQAISHGEDLTI